jgi:hypothetical protein
MRKLLLTLALLLAMGPAQAQTLDWSIVIQSPPRVWDPYSHERCYWDNWGVMYCRSHNAYAPTIRDLQRYERGRYYRDHYYRSYYSNGTVCVEWTRDRWGQWACVRKGFR